MRLGTTQPIGELYNSRNVENGRGLLNIYETEVAMRYTGGRERWRELRVTYGHETTDIGEESGQSQALRER